MEEVYTILLPDQVLVKTGKLTKFELFRRDREAKVLSRVHFELRLVRFSEFLIRKFGCNVN